MPASASLVTLDHAKDWAKRLKKASSSFSSLSQAQEAVSQMLGHASWHALVAFYGKQSSPSPSPLPSGKSSSANPFAGTLDFVNARFPGINAVEVQVLAHETDEIETDAATLADRIVELDREGYFPEVATEMALKEMTETVYAPPGFMMIRVRDANNKAFQVLLDIEDYRRVEGV